MTRILRSIRILSAAGVVGPLAASAIICKHKNLMVCEHTKFKLPETRKPLQPNIIPGQMLHYWDYKIFSTALSALTNFKQMLTLK
jgi:hypothetical protein